jgi:hypothetical protein
MAKRCLLTIARQELTRAVHSPLGRSERVLLGTEGGSRMSVLALRSDPVSAERLERPWTVQVLAGRVRLRYDGVAAVGFPGDLLMGPSGASLYAEGDCVVLLTLDPATAARELAGTAS